jgi:hypothetical protein
MVRPAFSNGFKYLIKVGPSKNEGGPSNFLVKGHGHSVFKSKLEPLIYLQLSLNIFVVQAKEEKTINIELFIIFIAFYPSNVCDKKNTKIMLLILKLNTNYGL